MSLPAHLPDACRTSAGHGLRFVDEQRYRGEHPNPAAETVQASGAWLA